MSVEIRLMVAQVILYLEDFSLFFKSVLFIVANDAIYSNSNVSDY
jgi:hypothetical protein